MAVIMGEESTEYSVMNSHNTYAHARCRERERAGRSVGAEATERLCGADQESWITITHARRSRSCARHEVQAGRA